MTSKAETTAVPFITDFDLHLFNEGTHQKVYEKLGAHVVKDATGKEGTHFAVWAPNAKLVTVVGDFNKWDPKATTMETVGNSGVWATFVPGIKSGEAYKYNVEHHGGKVEQKSDPVGFFAETRPKTASVVFDLGNYKWQDEKWIKSRGAVPPLESPISIYEVHLGSWMRVPEEKDRWLTYRELADKLTRYVSELGFTHVEFLPVSEHPLDSSWGYQPVGFFAPTARFGTPEDFMFLIDSLHQSNIGVILDWVPSHFPKDGHGLGQFDGTHLFEHDDWRIGEHKEWGTYVFNYGRYEVSNFLLSNALFWLDKFHIDGLRVDAVASMLYRDYGRKQGDWLPNEYGGNENLEAIAFMKKLNETIYAEYPATLMIAEESTAWPQVSRPTYVGGLGFGFKWDMGWMHDTLKFFERDPVHRKFHHNNLTFRSLYWSSENFVLPLSHDEVVYGKKSLLNKMPGDYWQKFANLRLLFGYMWTVPGKKLLFMGGEFGQYNEWYFEQSLDWHLLDHHHHHGVKRFVEDLNKLYKADKCLHEQDCRGSGFEWVDCNDWEQSILSYMRRDVQGNSLIVVANFTPVPRYNYMVGVPGGGTWREVLNSDATVYGGSGVGNMGAVEANPVPIHGRSHSVTLTLPPLGIIVLAR